MATELLPIGNTAADSADLVVSAGTPVTVGLKGAVDGAVSVAVSLKDDAGGYLHLSRHSLTPGNPAITINGPGTYRFTRRAGQTCGVFSA